MAHSRAASLPSTYTTNGDTTDRPPSETEGSKKLYTIGSTLTNLPPAPTGYVRREKLESEVSAILLNDRHPIVTLYGQGGVGKTSLILSLLHDVAISKNFDAIYWFSARDIDLTQSGPKVVRPGVLAEQDIAKEYLSLIDELTDKVTEKKAAVSTMAEHLRSNPAGKALFVFDNFETIRSPVDLFNWIDTNIRLPNKVVITSRFHDFKADYPITVRGMEKSEAEALVSTTALGLGIDRSINASQIESIIDDAGGHPYVIKIILGEIASTGKYTKPGSLIAKQAEILEALFERTFSNLTPLAQRLFLVLSSWRSMIPQLAVEAVTLWRHGAEGVNPEDAIDELVRMSLVERSKADDESYFLEVPLTASIFADKKLAVSPHRQLIEEDVKLLQDVGATSKSGLREGIGPRIGAFFKRIAKRVTDGSLTIEEAKPVMEFMARNYPPAFLLIADIFEETQGVSGLAQSAEYVRRYLEQNPAGGEQQIAWERLVRLYRALDDVVGGCSAFIRAAQTSEPMLHQVSNMANWLNNSRPAFDEKDQAERKAIFGPMASLLEQYVGRCSATDLSRLAWLHLHTGDWRRARQVASDGLKKDPENEYCRRLVERIDSSHFG